MIRHTLTTPPEPNIEGFAKRQATVTVTGVDGTVQPDFTVDIPKGQSEFQVTAELGEKVSIVLRDFDVAHNGSDPSEPLTFTVVRPTAAVSPPFVRVEEIDEKGQIVVPPPTLTASPTSGPAPLTVAFTTTGQVMEFNTGEPGAVNQGSVPETHIYETPGSYSAKAIGPGGSPTVSISVSQAPVTAPKPEAAKPEAAKPTATPHAAASPAAAASHAGQPAK